MCTGNKTIPWAVLVPSVLGHKGSVSPVVPCRCSWTSAGTWRSPTWRQQMKGLQSRRCSSPKPWETWRNIFGTFSQCYQRVGLGIGTHLPASHHVELSRYSSKKRIIHVINKAFILWWLVPAIIYMTRWLAQLCWAIILLGCIADLKADPGFPCRNSSASSGRALKAPFLPSSWTTEIWLAQA